MNARTFSLELDRWFKDEVEDKIVQITRMVGLEALKRVVLKSPVRDGRFRGNWQVAIGSAPSGETGREDKDGGTTVAAGSAVISGMSELAAIWLVNNVPYAQKLEGGSSIQAPTGVVAVTMAELEAFFSQVK